MARPKTKNEATKQLAFRFPTSLVARLDAYRKVMQQDMPGSLGITRADAVRFLLIKALDGADIVRRSR